MNVPEMLHSSAIASGASTNIVRVLFEASANNRAKCANSIIPWQVIKLTTVVC